MYLDRIEMTGFKSFADKTVIQFDQGLTAVVGPNGSGKSNLSEAIRWVLGEQSAKSLRGDRMEDVIFNGTQERRPVNVAKVTLVLNNEDRYLDYDFNEISITRSYNRNGDSQYMINQQPVRLKDIIDLLLDSGLGRNSFAMISQGKVESIFLSKPEERRAIFEEAAGVQRYQVRKQEAERKMSRSKEHLSRVEDIIYELEKQLKPLEKQRSDALSYQKLTSQLKEEEIALYTYQIEENQQTWQQAQKDDEALKHQIITVKEQMDQFDRQLTQGQERIEVLNQSIDSSMESYHQWTYQHQKNESKEEMLNQQLTFNEQSKTDQEKNRQTILERHEQVKEQLDQIETDQVTLQQERDHFIEQKEQLHRQLERLEPLSQEEMEAMRQTLLDWYQQEVKASSTLENMTQQMEQSQQQIQQLQEEFQQKTNQYDDWKETITELENKQQTLQQTVEQLRTSYTDHKKQLDQYNKDKQALSQKIFHQERLIQRAKANVQSLDQMQEDYAGYYAGVRSVMTQPSLKGIDGTVADLIDVSSNYQLAIDTALGAGLQTVVVNDDEAARRAIHYLRSKRLGRATFLPRTNARKRTVSQQIITQAQQMPGWVGIASDLVNFDSKDREIIGQLLGNTLVVEEISHGQQLAKAFNHTVKIVTLTGELLLPGGTVSGGRNQQERRSMLSRKNDLQQAKETLQQETKTLSQLEQQLNSLDEKISVQTKELESVTEQGQKEDQLLQQIIKDKAHVQNELNQLDRLSTIHNTQEEEIKRTIQQAKEQHEVAKKRQQEARLQIDELQLTLEQATLDETKQQQERHQLNNQLQQINTQLGIKEVEVKELERRQKELNQEKTNMEAQLQQFEQAFDEGQINTQEIYQQLEEVKNQAKHATKQIAYYEQQVEELRKERQIQQQTIKQLEDHSKECFNSLQTLYQQQASKQAEVERLGDLIDERLEYLNQTYQLSYEAAKEIAGVIEEINQTKHHVKQLKEQIDRLGPINLNAIEAYDELKERYDHLTEQQTDLLTAMDQLEETIEEMDKQVTTRFKESFDQINAHFQQTFKELFGGGSAQLELTDPNNLLATGVDIIAQPPGKKMQNLALLSGGERAFTAIALLFAILKARPVPFVVLDEVEAALDEANVYRYGEYLQSFAKQTQFIVITHRKGTMEHADMLYGVTMQQSGVSKLASVRLADYDESGA